MRSLPVISAALLTLSACVTAPQLIPSPQSNVVPGRGLGAFASTNGVRVEARAQAWTAIPENLNDEITPILVIIDNRSDHPLRIRYDVFQLATSAGQRLAALPPFNVRGTVVQPLNTFAFPYYGFYLAPYLQPFYPSWTPYFDPFFYDPWYYNTYWPAFVNINLPTGDMVQLALPEGVLEPGGRITGFLYFERVPTDIHQVSFQQRLVDAETGQQFGIISIPFVVEAD